MKTIKNTAFLCIAAFLICLSATAQKKMVLIEGFQGHEIEVSDSITEGTVKEFYFWANNHRVDYETKLPTLKAIRTVGMNKNRLHYYDRGVIYINSYADQFPYSKRILILHELGKFYGVPVTGGGSLDVMNENFYLTDYYEQKYINRKTHFTDMKDLMKQLEKFSRLKTK